MKNQQQELPDSAVLSIIVLLVAGTLGYFIYSQWQIISDTQAMADSVSAQQVAEKMAKEREDFRAVAAGKKKLEDLEKEQAASAAAKQTPSSAAHAAAPKTLWSKAAAASQENKKN